MAIAEPIVETIQKTILSKQWNVILLNDDDHSFEYVIELLIDIFHYDVQKAIEMTHKINDTGQGIVDVTTKERAELKQEQVHGRGADPRIAHSAGAVTCVIEPAE